MHDHNSIHMTIIIAISISITVIRQQLLLESNNFDKRLRAEDIRSILPSILLSRVYFKSKLQSKAIVGLRATLQLPAVLLSALSHSESDLQELPPVLLLDFFLFYLVQSLTSSSYHIYYQT